MKLPTIGQQIADLQQSENPLPRWTPRLNGTLGDLQATMLKAQREDMLRQLAARAGTTVARWVVSSEIGDPRKLLDQASSTYRKLTGLRSEHRSLQLQILAAEDSMDDLVTEIEFLESPERLAFWQDKIEYAKREVEFRRAAARDTKDREDAARADPAFSQDAAKLSALLQGHMSALQTTGNTGLDTTYSPARHPFSPSQHEVRSYLPGDSTTVTLAANIPQRVANASYALAALAEGRAAAANRGALLELSMRTKEAQAALDAASAALAEIKDDKRTNDYHLKKAKAQLERLKERADSFPSNHASRLISVLSSYANTADQLEALSIALSNAMTWHRLSSPVFRASSVLNSSDDSLDDKILSEFGDGLSNTERQWERVEVEGVRSQLFAPEIMLVQLPDSTVGTRDTGDNHPWLSGYFTIPESLGMMRIEALALVGAVEEMARLSMDFNTEDVTRNGVGTVSRVPGGPSTRYWPARVITLSAAEHGLSPSAGGFLSNLRAGGRLRIQVPAAGRERCAVALYLQVVGFPNPLRVPVSLPT